MVFERETTKHLEQNSHSFFRSNEAKFARSAEVAGEYCRAPNESNALSSNPNVSPYLITVKQAAARLQLGVNCVYGLTKAEQNPIPTVLIGRSIRIPTAALERWLEAQTRG